MVEGCGWEVRAACSRRFDGANKEADEYWLGRLDGESRFRAPDNCWFRKSCTLLLPEAQSHDRIEMMLSSNVNAAIGWERAWGYGGGESQTVQG